IVNSSYAHVYTVTPEKFYGLYKQRVRWTYGFLNNSLDYREMFFNKKYGHIGLFVLPIGIISIFTSLYIVANLLLSFTSKVLNSFAKFRAVGFGSSFELPSFDWYFINTGTLPIITITAIGFSITILVLALRLSEGKAKFSKGVLYYLSLYGFIVPFWLVRALFDTLFRKQISWR
ncbi:hypothetical protein COW99_06230, partial [Candidatus Roizmanbacteria bacterium CG22_combo_CG10-13_8_21_14_all_38_20]